MLVCALLRQDKKQKEYEKMISYNLLKMTCLFVIIDRVGYTNLFQLNLFHFWRHYENIVRGNVLIKCFTSVLQVFYACFTDVLRVFYGCFTGFSRCFTGVLRMFYECFTGFSRCFTGVLRVFYECFTSVLQGFRGDFKILDSKINVFFILANDEIEQNR